MIRPLRQRHRTIVSALAVLLPVAFAVGIAARRPAPIAQEIPALFSSEVPRFVEVVWTKADLWPNQRIITRLHRDDAGAVTVEFMFRDILHPDVLVYWAAGREAAENKLPDDARLLGQLVDRAALPCPAEVRGESGRFVLYSLAGHKVVAVSEPVTM